MLTLIHKVKPLFILIVLLAVLIGSLMQATPVSAAEIVVNSNADVIAVDGYCTLREAIIAANNQGPYNEGTGLVGENTITFAADYTITLADSSLPNITSTISIIGNSKEKTIIEASDCNPIIDATCTHNNRVLAINSNGNLTLDGVTVRNGKIDDHGGGILNQGTLVVLASDISSNSANYGGGISNKITSSSAVLNGSRVMGNSALVNGGGVYNIGSLSVFGSSLLDNTAAFYGGGAANSGTSAIVTITRSIVSGNHANDGGGISLSGGAQLSLTGSTLQANVATNNAGGIFNYGPTTIIDSIITGNSAVGSGGGIMNNNVLNIDNTTIKLNTANIGGGIRSYSELSLAGCTFSENSALHSGGGIYNSGDLDAINSTFSANSAVNQGGGIYNHQNTLVLRNCTFSENSAGSGGGGIYNYSLGSLDFANTIIANSTLGFDCVNLDPVKIIGNIHNLVEHNDPTFPCGTPYLSADPKLANLANNGGSTKTHALEEGSPAIDAGSSAQCTTTDQRGVPRPQNAFCDIGAFEVKQGSMLYLPLLLR